MKIVKMLERLSEMFPKQDYQSRLEQFIKNQKPDSIAQIEKLYHEFDVSENKRGLSA
jgi:hypothetical protein